MANILVYVEISLLFKEVCNIFRYRAVSQPIHYSLHARNVKRISHISIITWFISLAVAAPMVVGKWF